MINEPWYQTVEQGGAQTPCTGGDLVAPEVMGQTGLEEGLIDDLASVVPAPVAVGTAHNSQATPWT